MTKALLLLVTTGVSWVIVGAFVGLIGRKGLNLLYYQIAGCILRIAVSLTIGVTTSANLLPPKGIEAPIWTGVITGCLAFGLFNYVMIQFMGLAMQKGPNAIVWAIIQSGFIYPFFMGWIIFGEPMSAGRAVGIIMILASIVLYAARDGKDTPKTSAVEKVPIRVWLVPALLGMLFCGLNQCGGSIPSHLPRGDEFPSILRDLFSQVGGLIGCAYGLVRLGKRGELTRPTRRELAKLIGYAVCVLSVNYTASVVLLYPGLDILKEYGRISMGFPIMVASCIAAFFPYGLIVLREKINPIQALGAAVGIAGIIIGCL